MYYWRKLSDRQKDEVIEYRRVQQFPKHSLPHFDRDGECQYLLTGACYEHKHIIGLTPERMSKFERQLLEVCGQYCSDLYTWCLLPNHYHILLKTAEMKELRNQIGLLHGRTAFEWNGEDEARGRAVWRNCFERAMKSPRHYFASLNYVLNNPVHHGYVQKWQDWPWSNAREYLDNVGNEQAAKIWRDYPLLDYGKKWDIY